MSDATQEAFETALAEVFQGREYQFGSGPRKLLREFYDRAVKDAGGAAAAQQAKVGQRVRDFGDLQVGDVFQNDYLQGENRCRRVVRVINSDEVETEYVSTRSKRVVKVDRYDRYTFDGYNNYRYIADPGS
jgi:hypothetical protein